MIRKILQRIRYVISLPFRLITKPFRAFRNFIEYEPEDTPHPGKKAALPVHDVEEHPQDS